MNPTTLFLPVSAQVLNRDGTMTDAWWRFFAGLQQSLGTVSLTSQVSGILPVVNGGVGASLAATGGPSFFLRQNAVGAAITVVRPAAADLSDYAEGAWTPTLVGSSVGGAQTYSVQVGSYRRIGNLVQVQGRVAITAKDGAMAGTVVIGGLPFTPKNTANLNGAGSVGQMTGVTFDGGYTMLSLEVRPGVANLRLIENGSGAGASTVAVANIAAATDLQFTAVFGM